MGTVRIERDGEPLERLVERLSDPGALLAQIGQDLSALLQANLSPGHGQDTGLMKSAFADYEIYPVDGGMAVGIGDASVLTDWSAKAPGGTIAAFVRWLREQNAQNVQRRQKVMDAKRAVREAKRAAMERVHAKWDAIKAGRRKQQAEFQEYLQIFAGREVSSERLKYLEQSVSRLTRGRRSFASLRSKALEYGIRSLKLSPKRLVDYYKSVHEQLASSRETNAAQGLQSRLERARRGIRYKQQRAEMRERGAAKRLRAEQRAFAKAQRIAQKPIYSSMKAWSKAVKSHLSTLQSTQKWFTRKTNIWRARQIRIASLKAQIAARIALRKAAKLPKPKK